MQVPGWCTGLVYPLPTFACELRRCHESCLGIYLMGWGTVCRCTVLPVSELHRYLQWLRSTAHKAVSARSGLILPKQAGNAICLCYHVSSALSLIRASMGRLNHPLLTSSAMPLVLAALPPAVALAMKYVSL